MIDLIIHNGNRIKTVWKDSAGKIKQIKDFKYQNGKLAKTETTIYENGKKTFVCHDDTHGNTIYIEDYENGVKTYSKDYKYDANGNEIKRIRKGPDGKITDVWEYKYNTDGSVKETIHKDGKGNVIND